MGDIDWQYLLFRFDGRINRAKFWSGVGAVIVAYIVIFALFAIDSGALRALLGLAYLAMIWPSLAISIKRWHDRDKSGWWVLIGLVPVIGGIWALVETGDELHPPKPATPQVLGDHHRRRQLPTPQPPSPSPLLGRVHELRSQEAHKRAASGRRLKTVPRRVRSRNCSGRRYIQGSSRERSRTAAHSVAAAISASIS